MRKPAFCICENKGADQLRCNPEAAQRLSFRYTDSTVPLFPKSEFQASSHLLWLYSPVCVEPGQKPRKLVFSQQGSYYWRYFVITEGLFCLYLHKYISCGYSFSSSKCKLWFLVFIWVPRTYIFL